MYIDVVNLFESISQSVNPLGIFYHGRASDALLKIQNNPLPQIHLYSFEVRRNGDSTAIDIIPEITLALIFQDSPGSSDVEQLAIVNLADTMQRQIQAQLNARDITYSNYSATPYFKEFGGVTTGMFVKMGLQMKTEDCEV